MSDQLLLFKQEGQHVYDYTNVYDPDVDGSSVANSGKIVPAVRSIVIDNRTTSNKVYLVKAVNAITYKVTYQDFPYKVVNSNNVILNYGNDVFMLYYDNRTSPTRLTVDAKMILFGSNIAKYRLMSGDVQINENLVQSESGSELVVSDSDVAEVTNQYVNGIRKCNTCYTSKVLEDGDLVTLELYDSTGVLVSEVELIARKATILNALSAAANPITAFTVDCNQMDGDNWYLYKGQPVSNLSIYPTISFANGTSAVVPVDNATCFIYGLEDVDSTKVGNVYPVFVKYYINDLYSVAANLNYVTSGRVRVLSEQHQLVIRNKPIGSISKISIIPVWNAAAQGYFLYFFAYQEDRSEPAMVTSLILTNDTTKGANFAASNTFIDEDGTSKSTKILGTFGAKTFGSVQEFTVKFVASSVGTLNTWYSQTFKLVLKNPANVASEGTGRALWNICDPDNNSTVYGSDDAIDNRPDLKYDTINKKHYFDSTNQFTSKDVFLSTFYRNAAPPTTGDEAIAPEPTHFRIKDVLGNVLVDSMPVSSYHRGFVVYKLGSTSIMEDGIVVLEFLYNNAVVYGVPVIITQVEGTYVPSVGD